MSSWPPGGHAPQGYPPQGYGAPGGQYPRPPHGGHPGYPAPPPVVDHQPPPERWAPTPPDPETLRRIRARSRFFWRHIFPYLIFFSILAAALAWVWGDLKMAPGDLRWTTKNVFWLLLIVPLLCALAFHLETRREGTFVYSRVADLLAVGPGFLTRIRKLPAIFRITALILIVFALARPKSHLTVVHKEEVQGIDIMLALDVSLSMQDSDLSPRGSFTRKTRLDVAKGVIDQFIRKRKNDRIGLVIFGKEAYSWCPPTLDYTALRTLLSEIRLGIVNGRATAIGDALGTATNRLRRSKAESKVIILLTDGDNNAGMITPNQAANFARTFKIKIYTILMGRHGARRGLFGGRRFRVNPRLLEEIAALTGGTPYLATDQKALQDRFQRILDALKKDTRTRKETKRKELYLAFLPPIMLLIFLDVLLGFTLFRRFP